MICYKLDSDEISVIIENKRQICYTDISVTAFFYKPDKWEFVNRAKMNPLQQIPLLKYEEL